MSELHWRGLQRDEDADTAVNHHAALKLSRLAAVVPVTTRAPPVCRRPLFVASPLVAGPQCTAPVTSMRNTVAYSAGPDAEGTPAPEKVGTESGIAEIKQIVDKAISEEPVVEWWGFPVCSRKS